MTVGPTRQPQRGTSAVDEEERFAPSSELQDDGVGEALDEGESPMPAAPQPQPLTAVPAEEEQTGQWHESVRTRKQNVNKYIASMVSDVKKAGPHTSTTRSSLFSSHWALSSLETAYADRVGWSNGDLDLLESIDSRSHNLTVYIKFPYTGVCTGV